MRPMLKSVHLLIHGSFINNLIIQQFSSLELGRDPGCVLPLPKGPDAGLRWGKVVVVLLYEMGKHSVVVL